MDVQPPENYSSADSCPRALLARGPLASVDVCRCGMLHLHLGALTIRLTPEALAELVTTLTTAVAAHAATHVRARVARTLVRGCA